MNLKTSGRQPYLFSKLNIVDENYTITAFEGFGTKSCKDCVLCEEDPYTGCPKLAIKVQPSETGGLLSDFMYMGYAIIPSGDCRCFYLVSVEKTNKEMVRDLAYDLFLKFCASLARPNGRARHIVADSIGEHIVHALGLQHMQEEFIEYFDSMTTLPLNPCVDETDNIELEYICNSIKHMLTRSEDEKVKQLIEEHIPMESITQYRSQDMLGEVRYPQGTPVEVLKVIKGSEIHEHDLRDNTLILMYGDWDRVKRVKFEYNLSKIKRITCKIQSPQKNATECSECKEE